MKRRSKKKTSERFKFKYIIILFLLLIPLFYLGRKVYKYLDLIFQVWGDKRKMLVLKGENEVLQGRIDAYKKGLLLEARARDDLGMIKKGDRVYLISGK